MDESVLSKCQSKKLAKREKKMAKFEAKQEKLSSDALKVHFVRFSRIFRIRSRQKKTN